MRPIALFLATAPLFFFLMLPTQASRELSVRLDDLLDGLSFDEQMRFRVQDINVGTQSVKHLFKSIEQKEPSWWEYYTFKNSSFRIGVNNRDDLAKLLQTLTAQQSDRLRVVLRDDRKVLWRALPGLRSEELYTRVLEIVIAKTPCDELSQIVYTSINSFIKERIQLAGKTNQPININELFEKLLHEEIEPYIHSLDAVSKDDQCFKTFQLLRWIRGEDVAGFDLGEYRLHDGLQRALEPAVAAFHELSTSWSQYALSVKAIGHTDPVVVRTQKDFRLENTGIDGWQNVEEPLNVRYSGCASDRTVSKNPVFVGFGQNTGVRIEHITDNCKLGAVRAYVAIAYLRNKLGLSGVQYSYATGGIYSTHYQYDTKADATKRRVDIELTIKAAKSERSTRK